MGRQRAVEMGSALPLEMIILKPDQSGEQPTPPSTDAVTRDAQRLETLSKVSFNPVRMGKKHRW